MFPDHNTKYDYIWTKRTPPRQTANSHCYTGSPRRRENEGSHMNHSCSFAILQAPKRTQMKLKRCASDTWQESSLPFPAQSMFAVILEGLYLVLLHSCWVSMGTWTSCTTEANCPPSEVRPQPTTVPNFPAGSTPGKQLMYEYGTDVDGIPCWKMFDKITRENSRLIYSKPNTKDPKQPEWSFGIGVVIVGTSQPRVVFLLNPAAAIHDYLSLS